MDELTLYRMLARVHEGEMSVDDVFAELCQQYAVMAAYSTGDSVHTMLAVVTATSRDEAVVFSAQYLQESTPGAVVHNVTAIRVVRE